MATNSNLDRPSNTLLRVEAPKTLPVVPVIRYNGLSDENSDESANCAGPIKAQPSHKPSELACDPRRLQSVSYDDMLSSCSSSIGKCCGVDEPQYVRYCDSNNNNRPTLLLEPHAARTRPGLLSPDYSPATSDDSDVESEVTNYRRNQLSLPRLSITRKNLHPNRRSQAPAPYERAFRRHSWIW